MSGQIVVRFPGDVSIEEKNYWLLQNKLTTSYFLVVFICFLLARLPKPDYGKFCKRVKLLVRPTRTNMNAN